MESDDQAQQQRTRFHAFVVLSANQEQVTMVDQAFIVELKKSGKVLSIPPDRSILDVLLENGVYVMTSCENGVCGTCVTTVLAGEPDHRDEYFTDEERASNGLITLCVSRAHSGRLVLDL